MAVLVRGVFGFERSATDNGIATIFLSYPHLLDSFSRFTVLIGNSVSYEMLITTGNLYWEGILSKTIHSSEPFQYQDLVNLLVVCGSCNGIFFRPVY